MPAPAQGIREGDELSGDGRDDDLLWSSGLTETLGKDFQAWVVMSGDQGGLEHHVSQGTTAARNGPFPAKCSTVMGDRRQAMKVQPVAADIYADDAAM